MQPLAIRFPTKIFSSRRSRSLFFLILFILSLALLLRHGFSEGGRTWTANLPGWAGGHRATATEPNFTPHPIDRLIRDAYHHLHTLLAKRSFTVEEAAANYRERRGRHPPPGFDVWFEHAQRDQAVIVEEFFDRIHDDINPFWALDPRTLRRQAHSQPQVIRVRNRTATFETDDPNRQPWIQLWHGLIREMSPYLPDLDMVVNVMDETRLLVPWEQLGEYVQKELQGRRLTDPKDTISRYSGLQDVETNNREITNPDWITSGANQYWDHLRQACPPDSPGRNITALETFDGPVEYPHGVMPYMYKGFIHNVTQARDPCLQPHLRGMHGTFVESVSMSTLHALFPMFGGSKLPQNNELLIPGAMYLSEREFYNGGQGHGPEWPKKKDGLVWRGTASGGRNKIDNWWHFHRHRWVQMMNGSTVTAMEAGETWQGPTFDLPTMDQYPTMKEKQGQLGHWLANFSDVAFMNLECFADISKKDRKKGLCPYTSPFMSVQASKPMKQQYKYKYLPDVDGNSFSARWRAFLLSTSLPLKATIYTEWHDDRLIPWLHFVPFDNSYMDIYGVMDYFLDGRDRQAEMIALEGAQWAAKVYRREDMKLYVWRLLLEYARVVDDRRDLLAYVDDVR